MTKPSRKITGLGVLFLGSAVAIACGGGGTTDAAGTGGTGTGGLTGSGSSGTGAGTSTGGAGTGGGATVGAATGGSGTSKYEMNCSEETCASDALIDDFEDGDNEINDANGTKGYWYSYAAADDGGAALGVTISDPADDGVVAGGKLKITATGLATGLSAGFGAELNQLSNTGCALDASSFAGLHVVIKGTAGDKLKVNAVIPEVVPEAGGGTCKDGCYNSHFALKTLTGADETWDIPWSSFAQDVSWGTQVDFDPARITKIQFSSISGATGFSVEVDEVSFYGTGTGTCDGGGGAGGAAP